MIRVGRCRFINGKWNYPTLEGYVSVVVMMKSHSKWSSLSPYELKDEQGRNLECLWQFSKVYQKVPKVTQRYSRWSRRVIWEWPAETHVGENGKVLPAYWKWREAGMNNPEPIRYPVGYRYRHKCLYSINDEGKKLDYIDARKQIYYTKYKALVSDKPQFQQLKQMLNKGMNLLIIEVDGPHEESLPYYQEKYDVDDDFITSHTVEANEQNLTILLNDEKHPFGHGYCLAAVLLDIKLGLNF